MENRLFYIIRHGETEFNKLGIVQGSGVDMPLNQLGIDQAQKFYKHYKEIKFNKIYTSSLIRTYQSVLPFIEAGYTYEAVPALNEISWGIYEGKPQNEVERKVYGEVVKSWNTGNYSARILAGESALDLQLRQSAFVQYLKQQTDECVLIAMHGRALKCFLCNLLELPLSEMDSFEHRNLCLYVLEFDGNKFSIIKNCDITHLMS
jgi:broad specificity phosphatase PhoE